MRPSGRRGTAAGLRTKGGGCARRSPSFSSSPAVVVADFGLMCAAIPLRPAAPLALRPPTPLPDTDTARVRSRAVSLTRDSLPSPDEAPAGQPPDWMGTSPHRPAPSTSIGLSVSEGHRGRHPRHRSGACRGVPDRREGRNSTGGVPPFAASCAPAVPRLAHVHSSRGSERPERPSAPGRLLRPDPAALRAVRSGPARLGLRRWPRWPRWSCWSRWPRPALRHVRWPG